MISNLDPTIKFPKEDDIKELLFLDITIIKTQGVLPNKEVGGSWTLGKIWGKVWPSSPNKRKNLGSSVTTRPKSWGKVPILGSYLKFTGQNLGYLSLIFLDAKFGAPTRISEANFGAKPPDLLIWKYPTGH